MIIGVTGHQNLPSHSVSFIEAGIEHVIRDAGGGVTGVTSLAGGADQLFAQIVLRLGGALHVIVPSEQYESAFKSEQDLSRFRTLLAKASRVATLKHEYPSEEAFLDAGRRVADLSEILIAVWDGDEAKGQGGTGDIVRYARDHSTEVVVIWPEGLTR